MRVKPSRGKVEVGMSILEHVKCEYCDNATDIDNPEVTHRESAEPIWICPDHNRHDLAAINEKGR